jgi:predicted metal-dependent HD superfamily phosphohydrolase
MKYKKLTEAVKQYVVTYFHTRQTDDLSYHNLGHTQEVAASAHSIGKHYRLSDEDLFIVVTASWFHDTGYLTDKKTHEITSVGIAEHELRRLKVGQPVIDKVTDCILATKMPQQPKGILQEIICDADFYHLGTKAFSEHSKQLHKEIETIMGVSLDKDEWRDTNIMLLRSHHFFTDYCRRMLATGQQNNLEKLLAKQHSTENLPEVELAQEKISIAVIPAIESEDHSKKHKAEKAEKPEKGIETMFRISSANHQRLSDMADNKAHIMITVNSIILSAIISLVLRKLDDQSKLLWPTFLLLAVSVATMTFSILATRPSIPHGLFTKEAIEKKTVNLLFFGNFYRMDFDAYNEGMLKMMDDSEFLYGSLIRDNYHQGVVLGKKYWLLRAAYSVFMYGLIIAVAAFIVAALFTTAPAVPVK